MFKHAIVYRIAHWEEPSHDRLEERLGAARFVACGASQPESAGWIEPRGDKHGPLLESVGGHWILKLCTETKAVPGGAVKAELEARLDKIEQDTGRRPKGKAAREIKEELVRELLPRAFPKRGTTPVWIDLKSRLVVVGAGSANKADQVTTGLVELLGGQLRLEMVNTQVSPAAAMSAWLGAKEAPAGFTLDRECELKQPDSEKSLVRYARHTLEIDEVGEHIRQGKLPTALAMTWAGRVSFVLTDNLAIRKIKLLDVALEGRPESGQGDEGFDGDVAIITGELGQLIPDLVEALGGWLALGDAGTSTATAAKAPTAADRVVAAFTGQPAEGAAPVYAPARAEDADAPF